MVRFTECNMERQNTWPQLYLQPLILLTLDISFIVMIFSSIKLSFLAYKIKGLGKKNLHAQLRQHAATKVCVHFLLRSSGHVVAQVVASIRVMRFIFPDRMWVDLSASFVAKVGWKQVYFLCCFSPDGMARSPRSSRKQNTDWRSIGPEKPQTKLPTS